jgi:hypothetical protein
MSIRGTLGPIAALLCWLVPNLPAAEKDLGPPHPIQAKHWTKPFAPGTSTLVGSYVTVLRRGPNDFVAFNNTVEGGLTDGLQMWEGASPTQLVLRGVVFAHDRITDVFGKDGALFAKRRLTRPFIAWHPHDGFVGIPARYLPHTPGNCFRNRS